MFEIAESAAAPHSSLRGELVRLNMPPMLPAKRKEEVIQN